MRKIPEEPSARNALARYLGEKKDRTPEEVVLYLMMRLDGDDTAPNAQLFIAYADSGMFRRVVADGLSGADIRTLVALAGKGLEGN